MPPFRFFMLLVWTFVSCSAMAQGSGAYPYSIPFEKQEVPVYAFEALAPQVALRMEYAGAAITNPEDWLQAAQRGIPRRIDLVFTKYPLDSADWFTGYQRLIHDRLRSLFSIDPMLEQQDIEWRLVLQTNCQSESQARKYFHGFVIQYEVTNPLRMRQLSTSTDVERVITGLVLPRDSSILNIMDRNRQWKNVLVIMDWTGSMYDYGAQVVLWHKLNMETSGIKHLILFNDGDKKATWQKQIGRTGGIYHARCNDLVEVVETTFIPLPYEALFVALCLAARDRVWLFILITTLGSATAGAIMYGLGGHVAGPVSAWLGMGTEFEIYKEQFAQDGLGIVFLGGITFAPSPLINMAAGASGMPFWAFVGAFALSRFLRFALIGTLLYFFGDEIIALWKRMPGWLHNAILILLLLGLGYWAISPFLG